MSMIRATLSVLVLVLLAAPLAALAQDTHPFSIHDMLAMERISDPQVSPDGKWVSFTLRTTDMDANKGRTEVYMTNLEDGGLERLTWDPASDNGARWLPDSRHILFLSARSGSYQVWRLDVINGEPEQVTDLPLDVGNLVVSPDGSHIAFSMDVFVDCETVDCTAVRLKAREDDKASGMLYDKLFIRHWDTWKDGRRSHVFVMPTAGGSVTDVMPRMDADCPSKPFGGAEEFVFTPDGKGIVFTARDAGDEEAWSVDFDLYYASIDGSKQPECLTTDNEAWDTQPAFSPDGKTLAWLAMARPGFEADRFRIVLQDWSGGPGGAKRVLTEEWDRSARGATWAPDGKKIFTTADNFGQRSLFSIEVKSGKVKTIVEQGTVRSPVMAGKRIVFGMDHLKSPVELYSVKDNGKNMLSVTRINSERMLSIRMGEPEQFTFTGAHGDEVYGYVVKPVDFDESKKYPVAFLIHGGPQGSFGNDFHYRWNPQAYTGAGYAAVMVDFHGSVGYGQAFTDAIRGDWGGAPLEDLQKGLAAALAKYSWLDGDRVAGLGASYGGYMVNWIAGNWPDRFRCLINHDGNLDERMAYYDTEELWFPEWERGGTPWENPEAYTKHNPIEYVQNWRTPMLVIHGAKDYRVVDTQGISTFTLLQRKGIPSRFLYFPDENHWVLKPHNSVLWHDTVIGWMDEWTKMSPVN